MNVTNSLFFVLLIPKSNKQRVVGQNGYVRLSEREIRPLTETAVGFSDCCGFGKPYGLVFNKIYAVLIGAFQRKPYSDGFFVSLIIRYENRVVFSGGYARALAAKRLIERRRKGFSVVARN